MRLCRDYGERLSTPSRTGRRLTNTDTDSNGEHSVSLFLEQQDHHVSICTPGSGWLTPLGPLLACLSFPHMPHLNL